MSNQATRSLPTSIGIDLFCSVCAHPAAKASARIARMVVRIWVMPPLDERILHQAFEPARHSLAPNNSIHRTRKAAASRWPIPMGTRECPRATLMATPAAIDQEIDFLASAAARPARDGKRYMARTAVTNAAAI